MPPIDLWRTIVEILILAVGIYVVLRFLEGTLGAVVLRGAAVAFGVAAVLALFVVQQLELTTLQWVLARVFTVAAIGLIVIFQPDLRRALVRLGETSLFHMVSRDHAGVIPEIVKAAEKMAAEHIGALIAIHRAVPLNQWVERGVKLDAQMSAELLQTIFYPNSPLSDGAVVISEGRIVAAGCLFPLTERTGLSPELGTRHRAGIGITEQTDALAVLVSEERGEIALAVRGQLHRQLTPAALGKLLRELQAERAPAEASGAVSEGEQDAE